MPQTVQETYMRLSQFPLSTLKETPNDAEVISHQLMLRAGMIRRLASGLYTWMPLGLKVLRKVEAVVREEMNKAGGVELLMPTIQPSELWQESGRWEQYGPELMRLNDRHGREFCYGPTHEEVITDLARRELKSYKQLPINYYQVQLKFRDEIRPRFGVMRSREFLMKDAYSFHIDQASLQSTYETMYQAYTDIFTRLGLNFRAVDADTGSIGGQASHEFHVLADSGEDAIAFCANSDFAANIEKAACLAPTQTRPTANADMLEIATPKQHSIDDVSALLKVDKKNIAKTLLVAGTKHTVVALVLRGDHELNEIKAEKHTLIAEPLRFATEDEVEQATSCKPGSVGPLGLSIPVIADHSALIMSDFVCGANKNGVHLTGINWERDLPLAEAFDLRNIEAGDPSPCGQGTIEIVRGIEVGHIFQLGNKYSKALGATVLNENGKEQVMTMGCYGIGVTRVIASAIEQNHDEKGITWPAAIAPFTLALVPMNMHKSQRVKDYTEALYNKAKDLGIDVMFDDRDARPGVKFADIELIGIPHRLVIGERGLDKDEIEYKGRGDNESRNIALDKLDDFLQNLVSS